MAQKQFNMTYAIRSGEIVSIDDVESGLKCGCVCPACGEALVAKKGKKVTHHFAHYTGKTCEYGYESSLHYAAKEILTRAKRIILPPLYLNFPGSYKERELISDAKEIEIDHVCLEMHCDDIVPDIVVYAKGKKFFIEIYVTHPINDEKLAKIRAANVSTIEIDLSKKDRMMDVEELRKVLLGNNEEKKWKYNVIEEKYLQAFYNVSDELEMVLRGLALHVDNCPMKVRIWKGKAYANFIDDCLYCKYCIAAMGRENLLCSGRKRIAILKDFEIPDAIRIKESDEKIAQHKKELLNSGRCPSCGAKLVERKSKYGVFRGCDNYPRCRFIAKNTGAIKTKE